MAPALLCAPICTPVPVSQSVLCGYEESLPPRPAVSAYGVAAGSCLTQSADESSLPRIHDHSVCRLPVHRPGCQGVYIMINEVTVQGAIGKAHIATLWP